MTGQSEPKKAVVIRGEKRQIALQLSRLKRKQRAARIGRQSGNGLPQRTIAKALFERGRADAGEYDRFALCGPV